MNVPRILLNLYLLLVFFMTQLLIFITCYRWRNLLRKNVIFDIIITKKLTAYSIANHNLVGYALLWIGWINIIHRFTVNSLNVLLKLASGLRYALHWFGTFWDHRRIRWWLSLMGNILLYGLLENHVIKGSLDVLLPCVLDGDLFLDGHLLYLLELVLIYLRWGQCRYLVIIRSLQFFI